MKSGSPSLPAAKIGFLASAARTANSAGTLALLFFILTTNARAAWVSFAFTNSIGQADTNYFKAIPVSGPVANADGSFTTIGLPIRIVPVADGRQTNQLAQNNYFITNAFLGQGYYIRVPQDSGGTVYPSGQLLISGGNVFVTVFNGPGSTNVPTFNQLTNVFGGSPLVNTNLPGLTNGFIRLLDATNVSAALGANLTNYANTLSNQLQSQILLTLTSAYATNAAGVTVSGRRVYVSTNYEALGAAAIVGGNLTNYANTLSNQLQTQILLSLTNAYATNAAGVTVSGPRLYISTNYDGLGFAATVGGNLTNYANTLSNQLQSQIVAGGITAAGATNIAAYQVSLGTNGYSPLVFTNVSQVLYTNRLPALTNGFIRLLDATNVAMIATNGYSPLAFTNVNQVLYTNALPGLTNGFIRLLDATNVAMVMTNGINQMAFRGTNLFVVTESISFSTGEIPIFHLGTNSIAASGLTTNSFPLRAQAVGQITVGTNLSGVTSSLLNNGLQSIKVDGMSDTQWKDVYDRNVSALASDNGLGTNLEIDTNNFSSGIALTIQGGAIFNGPALFNGLSATNTFSVTNGSYWDLWTADGGVLRTNTAAPFDWEYRAPGGLIKYGTNNVTKIQQSSAGTLTVSSLTAASMAAQTGKSNFITIDNLGAFKTNDFATFVLSTTNNAATRAELVSATNAIAAGVGISAAAATNIAQFQTGIASNFLYATKLDETNATSYGQVATNLTTQGNVAFGLGGQATNLLSATNFVAFNTAGSSVATNGALVWNATLGVYTNWLNGATLTNNGSAWLLQTNGVTLYSLSGANPIGTYSAINGATPAPAAVYTAALTDHMILTGYVSVSNLVATFAAFTNLINNDIPNLNGAGTNTVLVFSNAAWGWSNALSPSLKYGAAILSGVSNKLSSAYSVLAGGYSNVVNNSGSFNTLAGGNGNLLGEAGGAVISGGEYNNLAGSSSDSVIGGGIGNSITSSGIPNSAFSAILGGRGNTIFSATLNSSDSAILGGQSNSVYASGSTAGGRFVTVSNANTFAWSDGTPVTTPTNSQFFVTASNGLYLNGPLWLNALSTNGGIYALSNRFSLYAVTNVMPNFSYWQGNSNGVLVTCFYSNGVAYFKNNWP